MPITDSYERVALGKIVVKRDERQRRELDTKGLIDSIKSLGVLQPIILKRQSFELVAGERRLLASQQLGLPDIPVRWAEDLSETEAQIIELEENIKRQDLEWQDLVRSIGRIHQLHCQLDRDWTLGETANAISLSSGAVSMYLKVFAELEDEKVVKATTIREAYNLLGRRDQRAAGEALQEILETTDSVVPAADTPLLVFDKNRPVPKAGPEVVQFPKFLPPQETIICESFLHWVPKYTGKKFNLIHCDFPYGVNLFGGPQSGRNHSDTYSDTKDIYVALLECLCTHLDKVMAISGHMMFWYSQKHHDLTMDTFRRLAPSLSFNPFPLIWTKSDNAGIASDVRHGPRHIYETCLLATRGNRNVVKVVSDSYPAPTDKRFHVSTKPEPMLKHFMSMLVDDNTTMFDPTCGSASSIRAAEELGARRCFGMDIDEQCVGVARHALKTARSLRSASREL